MSAEEITIPEITTPAIPSTRISIVPIVIGVAVGVAATLATSTIIDRLKKAKAEKVIVVVPEETPKTD